ncbi:MAG TPA: HNH endonuclease signature motif containing protein [Pirellulales bacterium]
MDAALRAAVNLRAGHGCEYCQRRQTASPLIPLQIEHIIPRKHGGGDSLDNLALACAECNLHKGSNLTGIDPETNAITPLFNPRQDRWDDHFVWDGLRLAGQTNIGRTTIRVLELNSAARIRVRLSTREGLPGGD